MSNEIEICNLALSNIRAGSINSFTEGSLAAQQCKLKYKFIRNRCLSDIVWGFNRKIRALSVSTTDIFTWAYAYQYPNDCLKIDRLIGAQESLANADASVLSRMLDNQLLPINDMRTKIPYEVFNYDGVKLIGTNQADLRIQYAVEETDPNMYTVDFILALSYLLASEIAVPVAGAEAGRQFKIDNLNMYKSYMNTALTNDLNEQYATQPLSEFETIRR